MRVYKDDINKAVGVAYKMNMHRLNQEAGSGNIDGFDEEYFWEQIEKQALRMIKACSNVMKELDKKE